MSNPRQKIPRACKNANMAPTPAKTAVTVTQYSTNTPDKESSNTAIAETPPPSDKGTIAVETESAPAISATPSPNLRPHGTGVKYASYKDCLSTPIAKNTYANSFNILQEYASDPDNFLNSVDYDSDDDTIENSNSQTLPGYSARFKIMVAIPKDGVEEVDATTEAIHMVNEMLKTLRNKFQQGWKIAPWTTEQITKKTELYKLLPSDIDKCEKLVHNFNRHNVSPGRFCYYRLHLFFPHDVPLELIINEVQSYTKSRVQFFQPAPSNALNPVSIGTFTGAVQEMAESDDFKIVLCKMFGFKHLGLSWLFGKSHIKGYNQDKFKLHGEIDMMDLKKAEKLKAYLNGPSKTVALNPLGTPLLLIPEHDRSLSQTDKDRVYNQVIAQESLSKSLDKVVVSGIKVTNWITNSDSLQETLLQRLMETPSITPKRTIRNEKTFYGRLFYAIVPNTKDRSATFYFTRANMKEGRSVARALPMFIQEEFNKSAKHFCDDELLSSANEGFWNRHTRCFETIAEREENERLETMKDHAHADVIEFISADHQRAMATENDDVDDGSRLTKNSKAAPDYKDTISPLASLDTMGTTESKAARAADARERIVTKQLTETYHAKLEERDSKIAELTAQMNEFAKFARVLESFTPDQVQKLSGASEIQMNKLHEAADDTDSDIDAAGSDQNSNGNENLIDGEQSDSNEDGSDNGNEDGSDNGNDDGNVDATMTVTPTGRNNEPGGAVIELDVTNDAAGTTVDTAIVLDSDLSDVDMHQPGISYNFAGSPPRKFTALSEKVKHLGNSISTREIPTNKKAKGTHTECSADTIIEGLDGGQKD